MRRSRTTHCADAYKIRKGWKPKKIYYNVVINLGKKLDAFFALGVGEKEESPYGATCMRDR